MAARDIYAASLATAAAVKAASDLVTVQTAQATIEAQRTVVGLVLQNGNAAYVTAVKTAALQLLANRTAAEVAKQAAIGAARETLRATGDLNPT